MKRSWIACAAALPLIALLGSPLTAEVKTREKSLIKFEGMLGRMVGMFGGKAARDGIVSTTAVKGDRKAIVNDNNSGQIIDLAEEKIYDVDYKKKEYRVTTFAELRQRMKEAQERAQKDAAREKERAGEKPDEPTREFEVDFDVKETGERKPLAGHDARQVIMTVTVREKGKALEEGGGFVMTSDSWLGPELAPLKELHEFDMRYFKQLYGTDPMGLAADQMAMVMAMYPMLKQASERLAQESTKLQGTPLATTATFEVVKSKAQMEASNEQSSGGGGIGGMLARKMMKKEDPKPRATIFTTQHEFQDVATTVAAADVEIPAGFKLKN